MKYVVKGEKIVREKFIVEVEASSFCDALTKTRECVNGEIAIERVNNELVTSETEAYWHDQDPLKDIWDGEWCTTRLNLLKQALLSSRLVKAIYVDFSGQGDDGQVDNVSVHPSNYGAFLEEIVDVHSVNNIVGDLADHILESVPLDWVNNNGGAGSIVIRLEGQKIKFDVSCHEWQQTEGFTFSRTLFFE
jgi:hypothetical protein